MVSIIGTGTMGKGIAVEFAKYNKKISNYFGKKLGIPSDIL